MLLWYECRVYLLHLRVVESGFWDSVTELILSFVAPVSDVNLGEILYILKFVETLILF